MPPATHSAHDSEDDAQLLLRCRRGEQAAWAALVRRYRRLVYAIALRAGLDEAGAADVFQTTFARLVEHLARIAQPDRLQAWLVTTAKREALLTRARALRTVSITRPGDADDGADEAELVDEALLPDQVVEELQQAALVRRALDTLDERCRTLLLLLFGDADDLPYEEIARRTGMAVGSIGPTRARCLSRLRKALS